MRRDGEDPDIAIVRSLWMWQGDADAASGSGRGQREPKPRENASLTKAGSMRDPGEPHNKKNDPPILSSRSRQPDRPPRYTRPAILPQHVRATTAYDTFSPPPAQAKHVSLGRRKAAIWCFGGWFARHFGRDLDQWPSAGGRHFDFRNERRPRVGLTYQNELWNFALGRKNGSRFSATCWQNAQDAHQVGRSQCDVVE
jgi:hypothetical protein